MLFRASDFCGVSGLKGLATRSAVDGTLPWNSTSTVFWARIISRIPVLLIRPFTILLRLHLSLSFFCSAGTTLL